MDELDEKIHIAFINSFAVIIHNKDAKELIGADAGWFIHNPKYDATMEDVETMLDYFVEIEDYEKCSEIKNYIDANRI